MTRPSASLQPLTAPVRGYDWGSPTAIPDLLGTPGAGEPQAEMWFGAHPGAPALVGPAAEPLDAVLRREPGLAGERAWAVGNGQFPFLMKLLAAARPLSLQVHPTREQAAAGHAREDAHGLSVADPTRSYKDVNHKPEIIVAITPFRALCGFRAPARSAEELRALLGSDADAEAARRLLTALDRADEGAALEEALVAILSPDTGMERVAETVVAAARHGDAPAGSSAETVRLVADAYGADPGVLVALLLNRVDLLPGEALFLDAGHVHAYLSGLGLEAMATSDNVLRGGLTSKHVDVPGLVEIVSFAPAVPHRITPVVSRADGVTVTSYAAPVPDFSVHVIDGEGGARTLEALTGPSVLVVTAGALTFGVGEEELVLPRGAAAFQAVGDPLRVLAGRGRAYLTTLGSA